MDWQEYQEAVAVLYEQLDDIGVVERNVRLPDKITGQLRQIDVLLKIDAYGHEINIVVDAKFHERKVDVKIVEEVLALAAAVGVNRAVIVAANGWTTPAEKKAAFEGCDLRLLTMEDALDLMVADKWSMCPACKKDCIVMDQDGVIGYGSGWLWWLAGQCRSCKHGFAWCQDCGEYLGIPPDSSRPCGCGHEWRFFDNILQLRFAPEEA